MKETKKFTAALRQAVCGDSIFLDTSEEVFVIVETEDCFLPSWMQQRESDFAEICKIRKDGSYCGAPKVVIQGDNYYEFKNHTISELAEKLGKGQYNYWGEKI